jgi:hypothetical protein
MNIGAIIAIAALSALTSMANAAEPVVRQKSEPAAQQATDLRGTEHSPLVVTVAPSANEEAERAAAQREKRVQAANEAHIVSATDWIAGGTIALAIATTLLWVYTYRLWKTSSDAARASDKAARDQLEQVTRSAAAMENVAVATQNNAKTFQQLLAKQARAYVAVLVSGAIYQEREKGLRFEGRAGLVNSGMTPAHRVRHQARAAILPRPLPADFEFQLPAEPDGGPILNPRETYEIATTLLGDFVPDEEVPLIKRSEGKALYVWGVVSYDDAFGEAHQTRFCHMWVWYGSGEHERSKGYYDFRHNDAT